MIKGKKCPETGLSMFCQGEDCMLFDEENQVCGKNIGFYMKRTPDYMEWEAVDRLDKEIMKARSEKPDCPF